MQRSLYIQTFGCQMNVYDSQRMESLLSKQGFTKASKLADADVILLNTCSIRDKAEQKVLSLLGELKPLKAARPGRVLGVAGCIGQRMGRTLLQKVPHLDLVLGPDQVDQIGELVQGVIQGGGRVVQSQLDSDKDRTYSQPAMVSEAKTSEFLTIMKGCDHFCTYCIVPFVRGKEKSRATPEILEDVEKLVDRGTKAIVFLGQNINTYGKGTEDTLAKLIEKTDRIAGLKRIRYVTSHPKDLGEDLIGQFGRVEKLCPQLHLPFQSGSDRILRRMARGYSAKQYLEKVEQLKRACPEIALSTDVIVGFPGETDEEFKQTLALLREVEFSTVYSFKYSERPGTKAAGYADSISEKQKTERLNQVIELTQEIVGRQNRAWVGKELEVLVESVCKKGVSYSGRTPQNQMVHIQDAGPACLGKLVRVNITGANFSNLKGTLSPIQEPLLVA